MQMDFSRKVFTDRIQTLLACCTHIDVITLTVNAFLTSVLCVREITVTRSWALQKLLTLDISSESKFAW